MTEPTPGPWIETIDGEANFFGIATSKDWLFRIQHNGDRLITEQGANINLIASAPEMLEALIHAEAILTYVPIMATNKGGTGPNTDTAKALKMVRAAIAKSEGKIK